MKRAQLIKMVAMMAVCVLFAVPLQAEVRPGNRAEHIRAKKIQQYNLKALRGSSLQVLRSEAPEQGIGGVYALPGSPQKARELLEEAQSRPTRLSSLGRTAAPSTGPGLTIGTTWDDWQWSTKGTQVLHDGLPIIHFSYTRQSESSDPKFGYNAYDPVDGAWLFDADNCTAQAPDSGGKWANLAISPDGSAILAGLDLIDNDWEHHLFWRTSSTACLWQSATQIPRSQYTQNFLDTSGSFTHPVVATQIYAGDTITHLIGHEHPFAPVDPDAENLYGLIIQYFRKLGSGPEGTWEGPVTIDTASYRGHLTASRVSGKVAVIYLRHSALAFQFDIDDLVDVCYRESSSGGASGSWGEKTNITNIGPEHLDLPWLEAYGMYDSEDELHVIWNATPDVEWCCLDGTCYCLWRDLSCYLYHWSSRTTQTSIIADRNYGLQWNMSVCGFGGANALYLAFFSLAECNGRLYAVYAGWNDVFGDPQILDDCSAYWEISRVYAANGELYLHASASLDGLIWDKPRNLTGTYTPECGPVEWGGNGVTCMNETKPVLDPCSMDEDDYGASLKWPGGEYVDPTGAYTGSDFVNLVYLEDHHPGNAALDRGPWTENDIKWMRIPCVDPILEPDISVHPEYIGYPYIPFMLVPYDTVVVTVTVKNPGSAELNVHTIASHMRFCADADWLWVSASPMTIQPAGATGDSATFQVAVANTIGPGCVCALDGEVYLLTNAPSPMDSVSIPVHTEAGEPPIIYFYDTLSTLPALPAGDRDDFIQLVTVDNASLGNGGSGSVNIDFSAVGNDCDPEAIVYLYSGSPFVMRNNGNDNIDLFYSMHEPPASGPNALRPVSPGEARHIDSTGYEAFFSGVVRTADSSIALELTTYAPTGGGDSTNFMIQKLDVFSLDGNPHSNLAIGSLMDWDVPADQLGNNNAGISLTARTVYFQGTDTTIGKCQENADRYGAQVSLGWHSADDIVNDSCYLNPSFHGAYAAGLWSDLWQDDSLSPTDLWDKTEERTGLHAYGADEDLFGAVTYAHGIDLLPDDTLTFYTVLVSIREGTVGDLEASVETAIAWASDNLRPGCSFGCCQGIVGNVDCDPEDVVDISDLTCFIMRLFIDYDDPCFCCAEEANADGDGDVIIDIGDLTKLIDYLFISYQPLPSCPL